MLSFVHSKSKITHYYNFCIDFKIMQSTLKNIFILAGGFLLGLPLLYIMYSAPTKLSECNLSSSVVEYKNCILPVEELLRRPELYHDKPVHVSGRFKFEVEETSISPMDSVIPGQIWVNFTLEDLKKRNWSGASDGIIQGIFNKNETGHYGFFQGGIRNPVIIVEKKLDQE